MVFVLQSGNGNCALFHNIFNEFFDVFINAFNVFVCVYTLITLSCHSSTPSESLLFPVFLLISCLCVYVNERGGQRHTERSIWLFRVAYMTRMRGYLPKHGQWTSGEIANVKQL